MSEADRLLARYRAAVEPTAVELEAVRRSVVDPDARFRIVRRRRRGPPRARVGRYAIAGALLATLAAVAFAWWTTSPGRATAVMGSDAPLQAPDRRASPAAEGDAPSAPARTRPRDAEPPPPAAATPPEVSAAPPSPSLDGVIAPRPAPGPKTPDPRDRTAAPIREGTAPDALERETALIQQAEAALRRDDPGAALAHTGEHARAFPDGVLVVERSAVRAIALCMSGREAQGRSEATKLQRVPASGPYRERMRRACDGP
jgi:hypothetical protein